MRDDIVTTSAAETRSQAVAFAKTLTPQAGCATVVALYGDLGSGKTTFVQGLAEAFGVYDAVQSPTFVIEKRYDIQDERYERLIHIDAYRIEKEEELLPLHFKETLADPANLVVIEWPERIGGVLPPGAIPVTFRFIDETHRGITVNPDHDSRKN